MNDKKRFPNERPEDVDKVLTDSLSDIGFIQYIIRSISDFQEAPTIIYNIDSVLFKKFLERIIKSLELLSGYITEELEPEIEALSGDLTEAYEENRKIHEKLKDVTYYKEEWRNLFYEQHELRQELERKYKSLKAAKEYLEEEFHKDYQSLESEKKYLEDDKLRVVDECVKRDKEIKRLKNLLDTATQNTDIWMKSYFSAHKEREELREKLENSEKMLKSAVSKIDELEYAKNKENKNSLYGMCAKYFIYLNPVNNGSNFCGNCRYCVRLMTGEYACRMPIPDRIIDPDDSSCQYFKQPYDTRTDQEVCAECAKKDDPDACNSKCPLYPF